MVAIQLGVCLSLLIVSVLGVDPSWALNANLQTLGQPNIYQKRALVNAITVTTDMGSGFGTNIVNTMNGVGLSSLSLSATHDGTTPFNSWVSASGTLTGHIKVKRTRFPSSSHIFLLL